MSSVTERTDDFPDRLSPMLVKELRQGLRAKTFVIVFLVLQGLLGLILLAASAGATSTHAGERVSEIVFVFFSLTVLVIQPLRGIGSLAGEIRGQTIDLMVLTRLSATRIVLGKWVAIVSQSALIAATIFPYLILRYYFGGMALFAELMLVMLVLLLSAGLTALTVGISACSSVLVRGILPMLASLPLVWCIFGFGFGGQLGDLISILTFSDPEKSFAVLLFVVAIVHVGWCLLSLGASLIAPHAENHATPRRLIAIVAVTLAPLLIRLSGANGSGAPFLWFIFAAPAITMALAEPVSLVPSIARSFTARGGLGYLAGRFFYPGWPSGVFFSAIVIAVGLLMMPVMSPGASDSSWTTMLALIGSLLLPGVIVVAAGRKVTDRLAVFILVWAASFALVSVLTAITGTVASKGVQWAFSWCPLILIPMSDNGMFSGSSVLMAAMIVDSLYLGILIILAIASQKQIRETEIQALAE